MRILDAEQSRAFDAWAERDLGVPALVLMENAAIGTVDALLERYPQCQSAAVLCGPGSNGADGWAVARHLVTRGLSVIGLPWSGGRPEAADTAVQRRIALACGVLLGEVRDPDSIERIADADVVVDALLGTGLSRPVDGELAGLLDRIAGIASRAGVPVVAVDLPTGLDASRGDVPGPVLAADLTVSFAALKWAHVFPPARDRCGEVVIADLGVPSEAYESAPSLELLDPEQVGGWLPRRGPEIHKGSLGHLLLVAGSLGSAGAAVLAARAALRSGAGRVTVATSIEAAPLVHAGCWEAMTQPFSWSASPLETLRAAHAGKHAVALGPGLGTGESIAAAIRDWVRELELPLVLDADGLTAFAGRADELTGRAVAGRVTLLTPHPGEMGRLLGRTAAEVQANRVGTVREAAARTGAVVVLKGHLSLIASPDGSTWVSPTGNPGMATAGCGDALTGILGALLARGYDSPVAAAFGTYLHGLAGDLVAGRTGEEGLVANDLIDELPRAWQKLSSE